MSKPIVSIIVPCYNTQKTLEETLESVINQDYENWEAIIVNDGSPDNLEAIALDWIEKDSRFHYYKKENGGLGNTRNFGIKKSKGKYILPLDSDNKLRPDFTSTALPIFESNSEIGVIYGNAMYFGEKTGEWIVGEFNFYKLLNRNFIDACAIIRKSLFEEIGGYDEKLPNQGHEDWDFWLQVMKTEYKFYYLNQMTFDYRVTGNSMIRSFDKFMMKENIDYITKKNYNLYAEGYFSLFRENKQLKKNSLLVIAKKIYHKIKAN